MSFGPSPSLQSIAATNPSDTLALCRRPPPPQSRTGRAWKSPWRSGCNRTFFPCSETYAGVVGCLYTSTNGSHSSTPRSHGRHTELILLSQRNTTSTLCRSALNIVPSLHTAQGPLSDLRPVFDTCTCTAPYMYISSSNIYVGTKGT